ncbi:hypothetical protein TRSC58_05778 [Trypanosoma rangeli SC58]|uniref:Uncharacterized protein n=1 Tax=Trypanosoma rangeli SC58 TaxID=429131 RepID=A0A061IXF8_TRYRA|nr:hypothetical protein TRSC58_05778 [Trypanosoma rangeli SC58]
MGPRGSASQVNPAPPAPLPDAAEAVDADTVRNYIAMAVPLLHMLQQRQTAQAAAVACEMKRRWGDQAGPAAELLRLLQHHDNARQEQPEAAGEEEEEAEDYDGSASDTSVGDDDRSSGSSNENDNNEEEEEEEEEGTAVENEEVMQALRRILERLPPSRAAGPPGVGIATSPTEVEELDEKSETEEEKHIFKGVAEAVEREMRRLAVVRKHR